MAVRDRSEGVDANDDDHCGPGDAAAAVSRFVFNGYKCLVSSVCNENDDDDDGDIQCRVRRFCWYIAIIQSGPVCLVDTGCSLFTHNLHISSDLHVRSYYPCVWLVFVDISAIMDCHTCTCGHYIYIYKCMCS